MGIVKFCLLLYVSMVTTSASLVNTTIGQIQGLEVPALGVEMFLGIPYAEAPEGGLRFKPPVRKARMEGVYNAWTDDKFCPQATSVLVQGNFTITEDCLRLDIYKPLNATQENSLPVMVWIHGGGYFTGGKAPYKGIQFASQYEVIMVAVNYRLGILGFLNTMDENSVGNFGLRDQCSAIEWVVENIEAFGGNASQVTIFGESAGSSSVLQLALSTLCQGKFQRVIAQSGTPFSYWSYNNDPLENARHLAGMADCPTEPGPLVTCLRQKSLENIVSYQSTAFIEEITWAPTYSADIFPENPLLKILGRDGNSDVLKRFRSMDLLLGVMAEEGDFVFAAKKSGSAIGIFANLTSAIMTDDEFEKDLVEQLKLVIQKKDQDLQKLLPAVKFQYTDWFNKDDTYANSRMYIRLAGDLGFMLGDVKTARLHASESPTSDAGNTYFYKFNRKPSWSKTYPWTEGATHADDLYFVFGYTVSFNGTEEEHALSREVMEYWTNFAKTGDPNYPNQNFIKTTWPTFNTETEEYIQLDVNMSVDSVSKYPFARRVAFWEEFFPSQLKAVDDYNKVRNENEDQKCKPTDTSDGSRVFAGLYLCSIVILTHFLNYFWI